MMPDTQAQISAPINQAEFHVDYIWVALAAALFIGFAIGAHMAAVIGLDFPLGPGFYSFVQVHGHVQLVAWAGLFIIGISLHFIPRLAGAPLANPQWIGRILWFLASGLILRSLGQSVMPYVANGALFVPAAWLVAVSGALEWLGILTYSALLFATFRRVNDLGTRPGLLQVAPFFLMMLAGWNLYTGVNLALVIQMAVNQSLVVVQAWNEFAIQTFTGLVLVPVAFAFSVRVFPLYLRLPAPDWPVRGLAYAYGFAFCLQTLPNLPPIARLISRWPLLLSSIGMILKGGVILFFVWKDLLAPASALDRQSHLTGPGRPGPVCGYGEFGRFERLVYAAYAWLVVGAILDMLTGASVIFGFSLVHSTDSGRHVYLLGFITLLIFGVSVRMIPGFMQKRKVWSPKLVGATFWLGSLAVVFRVVPLLLPVAVFEAIPAVAFWSQTAFAVSGLVAMAAVLCLTINLMKTV
jgi:hypothetical protein